MSEQFIKLNNQEENCSPALSPLKSTHSRIHLHYPSMDSQRLLNSSINLADANENICQQQLDPRYVQFKDLIEMRDASPNTYTMSIDDQELVASILYDFHHFKILIRQQRRLEFSIKLFKHIKIGWHERGEFFFHKGDSNKTDLICILSGKAAVFQKKPESYINQEMDLIGRIANLNQQIQKIEKSAPTINNEMSKAIHQLKQRIEHTEDKLNLLRLKDEDDLLKVYNFQKYFLTENVCGLRRVKYAERGSTLAEAQVVNGCACESTVVCLSKSFYFYISSQAYREIFGLEITKNSFICNILKQNFPGAKDDSLRRVSYDFREEIYEYNKVIFEENDPANVFMIVRQGEVEACRRIDFQPNLPPLQQEDQAFSPLTPEMNVKLLNTPKTTLSPSPTPNGTAQFFNQPIGQKKQQQQQQQPQQYQQQLLKRFKGKNSYKEISMGIIGEGQILGIEDAYNNRKTRSFKAISKSNETIIYYINKKQLDDVILLNDDYKLRKGIKNQSKYKSDYYDSRTDNLINFEQANIKQKENHILQENMKKQYIPESKNFKYLIQSWINQKVGSEEQIQQLPQLDLLNKHKSSMPSLIQPQSSQKIEDDSTLPQQEKIQQNQSQSPVKIPRRSQLRSLTHVQTNPIVQDQNFNIEEYFSIQQPTLESPPRKKKIFFKETEGLSPKKAALIQTISMPKSEEFPFKSDIDIINQQIEMKQQCILYQQQQREKTQNLTHSPSINPLSTSPQVNPISGYIQNSTNQQQSSYEQQQFEETKKRILFLKNFSNENKKNYRLKSEHSLINSILRKTSSMKLDFPQIQSIKPQQRERGSINEIIDISQGSEEASPKTYQILSKKNSLISIGAMGKRSSEILSSPHLDMKLSERKSENLCNNMNNYNLVKQKSQLNNQHVASFNPSNIRSLQNISSVSTFTDLNYNNFPNFSNSNNNNLLNLQKSSITNIQKPQKNENNDSQNAYQFSHFNSGLESIVEQEAHIHHHKAVNHLTIHPLRLKSNHINCQQGFSSQPSSPQQKKQDGVYNIIQQQQNIDTNGSSYYQATSEQKILMKNHLLNNICQLNEQSEANTPSTQQNTPSQLPQIHSQQTSQKDIITQLSDKDESIQTVLTLNSNNLKGVPVSLSELPSISNRNCNNGNIQQTGFPQHNNNNNAKQGFPITMIKAPLSPSEGFADIVKRIGLDPTQMMDPSKLQFLKNLSKLSRKPKTNALNNAKKQINHHPLIQQKRKNLSAACSPRNNNANFNPNNIASARKINLPAQLVNFRNESPLIIGKINYSVK